MSDLQTYRETRTLFPRAGFFGVLTLQGEKMLAEAVPGISPDSEEMQAVRAIGPVQCLALCAQLCSICTPFDASALYRCFLVATTPPPAQSSITSVPIDRHGHGADSSSPSSSSPAAVEIKPDPPLPIHGCHFWKNGDVSVRIQRRNSMFDHARASYVHPLAAANLSRTYWDGNPRLADCAQSEAALEWRLIADTLGWTGQNTAKLYPLAEFSLDVPSSSSFPYCSPSEYHDAVEQVRSITLQAWKHRFQHMARDDVPADTYSHVCYTEPLATATFL
ncbi:hypothetical protein L227DRAFT_653846 [Lentinus tigrinus ALCF2SS1-6]|uniref:Uncharacterized protein n=1 Tax=Lentinus tigrinus ALCF2SS1-6 TaxID=1328759 RepID=A0A5C2S756_9APHY|nr:hypothetical protein L227DRAFT_653846 [Lentinus tigrinus ALCF2SS1-6]